MNKLWSSNSFKGNSIIFELKLPKAELHQNDFHISKVLFGLPQDVNRSKLDSAGIGNFDASSPCNINVICPQGNDWQDERKAVCLIETADGSRGSGALIKNTCNTLIPYVLTAWHNTNGRNPNNWTFLFGWWSSTCQPNTNTSQSILFNGATLRATYEPTDFSLLELKQTPDANLNLSFLGWDRNSITPSSTTGIHHPKGDQMKISFDSDPPSIGNIRLNTNTAWRVLWKSGTTEDGSSGSPLFNQNHLVVGQLFSNSQPTYPPCNQQTGGNNYGRFDLSWTGGGTNDTRLSNWLDPNGLGNMTTNTTNIADLLNPLNFAISGSDYICSGSSAYTINMSNPHSTVSWSISNSNIASIPQPSTGTSVTVTKQGTGIVTLTASINSPCTTYTVNKTIMIDAAVGGYYRIHSNYHNYGIFNTLYNNNSPIWLPANQGFGVDVWLNSPGLFSATWSRAANSYPFSWNTSGTFLSFSGTSGSSAYQQRDGIFNLSAQTECGTYNGTFTWPIIVQGWGGFSIETSPNPASSDMTVRIGEESPEVKALSAEENIIMELIELYTGRIVRQWRFKNNQRQFNLSVRGLRTGQYALRVRIGKHTESKQVLITE